MSKKQHFAIRLPKSRPTGQRRGQSVPPKVRRIRQQMAAQRAAKTEVVP